MNPADQEIHVQPEPTPNPASVRFLVDRPVLEHGTADIKSAEDAKARSPLALALFATDGVESVFLGPNFVTITGGEDADWQHLVPAVISTLREHYKGGEPTLTGDPDPSPVSAHDQDEIIQGIMKVIDEEIRPAVAMDGGDVVFTNFHDGVVQLHLRGACSGCPSSMVTLKLGIERRLREEFPEVIAVEAV